MGRNRRRQGPVTGPITEWQYLIETDSVYTASATGVLYCFANDVWFMYWNNKGFIDMQVEAL